MEFWNSLLTEKSWRVLENLKKEKFRFIVIGGWAVYLWTRQHKSKDLDIIIPSIKDMAVLKQKYALQKNDALKKYEIKQGEIDVDVYVAHYSRFCLPIEELSKRTAKIQSFEVVLPEVLLILKQSAEIERKDSVKGQKDQIDIMTLLCHANIDFKEYWRLLENFGLTDFRQRLKVIVAAFRNVQHLNLSVHSYAKIKRQLLAKI